MSVILTSKNERTELSIYAPSARIVIVNTDLIEWDINITGDPIKPLIKGVRFIKCVIAADNLRAFENCCFERTCTMRVKSMPLCGAESINGNYVIKQDTSKYRDSDLNPMLGDIVIMQGKEVEVEHIRLNPHENITDCAFDGKLCLDTPSKFDFVRRK